MVFHEPALRIASASSSPQPARQTMAGAFEEAAHATGNTPSGGLAGASTTRPLVVAGVTGESTRDTLQRRSSARSRRAAAFPASSTRSASSTSPAASRHRLQSYEKGREKWQGATLDRVWFDEEPPHDIYTEGLTRTNATGGMVWQT